jgi:hypothetical protein
VASRLSTTFRTSFAFRPYWGLPDYDTAVWEGGEPDCSHAPPSWTDDPGDLRRVGADHVAGANHAKARQHNGGVCRRCGASRVEPTIWGGDPRCSHQWGQPVSVGDPNRGVESSTLSGSPRTQALASRWRAESSFCRLCCAWRGALGLEPTPELYVEHLVDVFREVRRVLRPDGTAWLNLGDSYAGVGKSGGGRQGEAWSANGADHAGPKGGKWRPPPPGLKVKDLVGIPWLVAFALRADGSWLRRDVIWAKPNPMPESVTDRPTASHEYLFLLTKSGEPTYWTHRERDGARSRPAPDHRWVSLAKVESAAVAISKSAPLG